MDRFDQYVELFKWFISSVAIVVVTLIIDTGFRERETGINEMKLYSDYVDVILKANNIEERYKLADYFATVTPTDRLRVRWIEYRNTIVESYMEFQALRAKEAQLLASSKDVSKELIEIQNKMKKHEGGLVGSHNIELATEWEANGFDFLIKKDVAGAINSFKKSEESFHGFHSVHEIYLYLSRNKLVLNNQDSKGWKKVYREILKRYSWKMPEEQKSILNSLAYGE